MKVYFKIRYEIYLLLFYLFMVGFLFYGV